MSTFKVIPTNRRTKNTAPYFYVEATSEKDAERNAVSKSRLLEEPKEWKAVVREINPKGKAQKKKRRNGKPQRKRMLILPNKKAA